MRKIRMLCVGKKQEPYLQSGIEVYQKKLKRYCQFEVVPLREANYGKGSARQWAEKEQKEIENQIQSQTFLIACDEKGTTLSSPQFAEKLSSIANQGYSKIDFIVGGPFGLPEGIKKRSDMMFSLSHLTLTHQMIRLFLAEQIYRAYTIIKGEKYHH